MNGYSCNAYSKQNNDLTISSELFSKLTTKNGNTAIEYFKDENTSKTNTAEISSDATHYL